jgi:hypothetical protein
MVPISSCAPKGVIREVGRCPLWVISGQHGTLEQRPLCPNKRPSKPTWLTFGSGNFATFAAIRCAPWPEVSGSTAARNIGRNGEGQLDVLKSSRFVPAWRNGMSRPVRIAVAAALVLGGTSLAAAKKSKGPARTAIPPHPGISETTSRPTVADPYYRLSAKYYGYSDPLRGIFDFYAVPPFSPGYTYGHVRPVGR